jgi:hypothetical protein
MISLWDDRLKKAPYMTTALYVQLWSNYQSMAVQWFIYLSDFKVLKSEILFLYNCHDYSQLFSWTSIKQYIEKAPTIHWRAREQSPTTQSGKQAISNLKYTTYVITAVELTVNFKVTWYTQKLLHPTPYFSGYDCSNSYVKLQKK